MSPDDFLKKKERLLRQKYDAVIALELLEARKQLATGGNSPGKKTKTRTDKFTERYAEFLTNDDYEFLRNPSSSPAQVAEYAEISIGEARKRIREGIYKPGRGDRPGGKRMADSISVVENLLNDGQT